MADVKLPSGDWDKLQKSALFLLPRLVDVGSSIGRGVFTKVSHEVAEQHTHSAASWKLASSAVTALFDLRPLGHKKCRSAVETYNLIAAREGLPDQLAESDIVSCVFFAPDLSSLLDSANLKPGDFESAAFPRDAYIVELMCERIRVPLTVGIRIAQRIKKETPDLNLRNFLSFQHNAAPKITIPVSVTERFLDWDDLSPPAGAFPDWTDWSVKKWNMPPGVPEAAEESEGQS